MGGEFLITLKKNILLNNIINIPNLNSMVKIGKCPQKMHLKRNITFKNKNIPIENYYKVKDKIFLFYVRYKTLDRNNKNTTRFFSIDLNLNVDYDIFPRDVQINVMLEICNILLKSKIFDFYLGSGLNGYDDIDNNGFSTYPNLILEYPYINENIINNTIDFDSDY
tara:strand:+ start:767 stop:1264 length:498 start_codon:yes stop_codon:yes gene_type:complete